jgi:hypothetical protein
VFEWYKRFSERKGDVEDDKQPSCLVMMETDENVEKVKTLVRTDCHSGIRMIIEELNMDKEMVRQILAVNVNMKR